MGDYIHIETSRLEIVPFSEEFLTSRYLSWLSDPDVVKYSQQRFHSYDLVKAEQYMRSFANTNNSFLALLLREDAEKKHIGNMGVWLDVNNQIADITIMIGEREIWGQGYGLEAWSAVMHHVLEKRAVRMVTGGCMAVNKPMISIMRKSGMKKYYTRKNYFRFEEGFVDSLHFYFDKSML
ncbi:MAG: GNAT family N-acetyltransferase [Alphaproteobacteria bacterium]|nr:GNAT family N-acetyltransferase [Alphaproteobacteria bacterium]